MEAGITRKAVSAACAYMFLWSHPLPLDKAEKKLQIFASIFGLLLCENVHVQKDRRINVVWSYSVVLKHMLRENATWFLEPADVTPDTWSWLLTTQKPA